MIFLSNLLIDEMSNLQLLKDCQSSYVDSIISVDLKVSHLLGFGQVV